MVLKLYGMRVSTCTHTVLVTLKEKGLPFEFVDVDFVKDIKSADHLKKQPFGQIPVLDDDGFQLYESRAIAKYLAAKYPDQGTKLVPAATDLQGQAKFDQAASVEVCDWYPAAVGILYEKIAKKYKGLEADEARVKEHTDTLNTKLDVYDKILGQQKYAVDNDISLVDLYHLSTGYLLVKLGTDFLTTSTRPNVARWWKDINSRPTWQEVVTEGALL